MQNLSNTIQSKINNINSTMEEILFNELLLTLHEIKKDFTNNSTEDFKKHLKNLDTLQTTKKNITSYIESYNQNLIQSSSEDENLELEPTISVSSNATQEMDFEQDKDKASFFSNISSNEYYFSNLNDNYGEIDGKLNLEYSLTNLEDYKFFSMRIRGIKLFDNIFLGRTINESMSKLLSFLFMLNEKPFIALCEKDTKYFSTSPSKLKRPTTLKEGKYYFESNLDEQESAEMLKTFLTHINVNLKACKILLTCSSTKENESYITFVF